MGTIRKSIDKKIRVIRAQMFIEWFKYRYFEEENGIAETIDYGVKIVKLTKELKKLKRLKKIINP